MSRKSRLERVSTGIPGLDTVTCGGLLRGGLYTVTGPPGSGKTVLCTHMAFCAATRGDRVVYATLLSESPGRMLENCSSFDFFDDSVVGRQLEYQSVFGTLQESGPSGLLALLGRLVRKHRAKLLVIDSVLGVEETVGEPVEYRRFLRDLATQAGLLNCTVLLVSPKPVEASLAELTIVDGVIRLDRVETALRSVRQLEIMKFRGSTLLEGRHIFDIAQAGVVVFPRTEALHTRAPLTGAASAERVSTGVLELDEMLRGGLFSGSTTCILGAPGTGKTGLCLNALFAAVSRSENALYFGFNESPDRLMNRAAGIGLDLRRSRRGGGLELLWQPPLEKSLDELAAKLFEAVERKRPSVVAIDGIDGFRTSAVHRERLGMFFAALTSDLRARSITTLATWETEIISGAITRPYEGISASFDNLLLLRYLEDRGQLHRTLTIIKTRESGYDARLHELSITSEGLALRLPHWQATQTGPKPPNPHPEKPASPPRA